MKRTFLRAMMLAGLTISLLTGCGSGKGTEELINVSYDATREFYADYNHLFKVHWKDTTGQDIDIIQSHGGSGKQALEVANGLDADVVTLALEGDIDTLVADGLIDEGYTEEFAEDSSPYTSTIVFLVRKGNPKQIKDWDDLVNQDVGVVTPNPKTSGGARWNYLAAWYYFEQAGYTDEEITSYMKKLYQNVIVLDSGARGSSTTFTENGQGDVLIAWENEAFFSLMEHPGEYEIVVPSVSIVCQPTVAIVDEVVDWRDSRKAATEYLNFLYSDEAQRMEAENYYRPTNQKIMKEYESQSGERVITKVPEDDKWVVTNIDMTDIAHFGGWKKAAETHFADGGLFDQIYENQ